MRRRALLAALAATLLVTAGCLGSVPGGEPAPTDRPTPTPTSVTDGSPADEPSTTTDGRPTPLPDRTVAFPAGPKDRPERPEELTAESAREFVRTHEYRYAYNQLWTNEHSDVSLACEIDGAANTSVGWRVVVSCTGHSNTGGESTGSATATVVHADWSDANVVYWVDEDSLIREPRRGE
ncbi:hypothetical protein [Halorarum halobium]|uniref:hypothetical protein n=1 Tax=Halorarum halobium TaxID=3075121 RepID=UPI0028A77BA5|nr:hypothetical protein [Halobaculum sp. XH14]